MKTQVNTLALALSAAALAPSCHAFASISSSQLRSARVQASQHPVLSLTSLEASSRSDSETALSAVMVEAETDVETTDAEFTSLDEPDDKAYLQDGFVFGLAGSGPERPKGKVANVVVEGDTLVTQPYQVAMVTGTFLAHAGFVSANYLSILDANGGDAVMTTIQTSLLAFAGWLFADLGSGVLHWSVDNYGNGKTPVMGAIIAAFQGHHSAPWTITERGFCNNVHKLVIPFGVVPMTLINFIAGPAVTIFFAFFCMAEILSQEFHKWSHMTKSQVPEYVNWLQNAGVSVGRIPHAQHHIAPYDGNYCIVSGVWNEAVDSSGIFRWMEHMVYNMNGVEANSWKLDADLKARTLKGDYSLPDGPRMKRA